MFSIHSFLSTSRGITSIHHLPFSSNETALTSVFGGLKSRSVTDNAEALKLGAQHGRRPEYKEDLISVLYVPLP